jgi:hypothetical protein
MPRFTPWHSAVPLDVAQSTRLVLESVLRPSLRRAFPLPAPGQEGEDRFRFLLDSLAYASQSKL